MLQLSVPGLYWQSYKKQLIKNIRDPSLPRFSL